MQLKKIKPQMDAEKRRFVENEDAVSITVGFILMLSITVLVFVMIILSFYTLTQRSEKTATQASFDTLGSELSVRITTIDTLVNITNSYGGWVNTLEYDFSVPATIALEDYSINVTNSTTKQIILQSDNGAKASIPFDTSTNITQTTIYSSAQDYKFNYSNSTITIEGQ
jgi:hypothetical protein